jgi:hypothetical protein
LLVGGPLKPGLAEELNRYWNIKLALLPAGDYGWGFVKLEPLFGRSGERFLVLDSDTVLTGPVLEVWAGSKAPFLVDDDLQSETETKRLYYDWEKISTLDPSACPPAFVFNTGQWFGTAGILTREDFTPWLEWTRPRRLREPTMFKQGEQGVLNYILNKKFSTEGLLVERRRIMRWPGHGMRGLEVERVAKRAAKPLIVHWAGMKSSRISKLVGSDLLLFFENHYYRRLPLGTARQLAASLQLTSLHLSSRIRTRLLQRSRAGRLF